MPAPKTKPRPAAAPAARPGDGARPPRRADVARLAGVSIAAVSQVLSATPGARISEATSRRIRECAATLGYVPSAAARALKRGSADAVGVMLCSGSQLFNSYSAMLLGGVWQELVRNGLRLTVDTLYGPEGFSPEKVAVFYRGASADGAILIAPGRDLALAPGMAGGGYPVVCVGDVMATPTDYVDIDNRRAGHDAVAHLTALGHREIVLMHGPDDYSCAAPRRDGARQALADAGLAPAAELRCVFNTDSGREIMAAFLAGRPAFTAVACAADSIAFGAIDALERAGRRVPDDVSVVGIDGFAHDNPLFPLTTMCQPLGDIGRQAARMVIERIAARAARRPPPEPRTVLFPTTLHRGRTTRPIEDA